MSICSDEVKITLKEILGNHRLVEVSIVSEGEYNTYSAVIS
jgi:hypothetical protein